MGRFEREPTFPMWFKVTFSLLMVLLFLKGIGVLTALTGIDPVGVTVTLDAGTLGTMFAFVALMFYLTGQSSKVAERLDSVEERLKSVDSRLEAVENQRPPRWGS